jgi:hypothetical protein
MAQQQQSVVTRERFDSGLTWREWMSHIQRNVAKFQYNYDETSVSEEDATALGSLARKESGPARVLVIGEDWCRCLRGPQWSFDAEAAGWRKGYSRGTITRTMKEF